MTFLATQNVMMMVLANVVHNRSTPTSTVCSTGQFWQYQPLLTYRAEDVISLALRQCRASRMTQCKEYSVKYSMDSSDDAQP